MSECPKWKSDEGPIRKREASITKLPAVITVLGAVNFTRSKGLSPKMALARVWVK